MSDQIENGDVWIAVRSNLGVPSKYFSDFTNSAYRDGPFGEPILDIRFNLTAYVRDMIAEAGKV